MKHIKKVLSLLLVFVMMIPMVGTVFADDPTLGKWGKLDWNYCDGTLTISGKGFMKHVNGDAPWTEFVSEIKTVVIKEGVTNVGDKAFFNAASLEEVILPASLETVGAYAFANCDSLVNVVIPEGTVRVCERAFEGCEKLEWVTLPNSVTKIDAGMFYGSDKAAILCYAGSYAEDYCSENDVEFELIVPFTDIADGKWYTDGVYYCYRNGYMAGTSDTTFGYKATVTRAMFATILAALDGGEIPAYSAEEMSFGDVEAGKWYSDAIEWAYRNGYAAGIGNGQFGRKADVSREQLATFFYTYSKNNCYDVSSTADLSGFADIEQLHGWAEEGVAWAVKLGLISGVGDNTLAPRASASRAEIALIINKYVENLIKPVAPDQHVWGEWSESGEGKNCTCKVCGSILTEAGSDSVPARDGTPKKYFTLCFDDGITQDARIIEILKKYNIDRCTFYVNTGLYGIDWSGALGVSHLRYTEAEYMSGIYDGFEVGVHTLTHPALADLAHDKVTNEVTGDAANIENFTGYSPVGMAWPGGDAFYTEENIKTILDTTNIRFARGTTSTYGYTLPEYFMKWYPTCSVSDPSLLTYTDNFINADCTEDMLFYVWGHGYEFDMFGSYNVFEEFIKRISEADDLVIVTNAEFYQLFKDEIPSWK